MGSPRGSPSRWRSRGRCGCDGKRNGVPPCTKRSESPSRSWSRQPGQSDRDKGRKKKRKETEETGTPSPSATPSTAVPLPSPFASPPPAVEPGTDAYTQQQLAWMRSPDPNSQNGGTSGMTGVGAGGGTGGGIGPGGPGGGAGGGFTN